MSRWVFIDSLDIPSNRDHDIFEVTDRCAAALIARGWTRPEQEKP